MVEAQNRRQDARTAEGTGPGAPDQSPTQSSRVRGEIKATLGDLVRYAAGAALVTAFVIQPVRVEGSSMLPHLHDGERILINKFVYTLDGWPSKSLSVGRAVQIGRASCR